NNARIGGDFVDDVNKELLLNKFAVIAEIQEDRTTPVDTPMEAIGGVVFRRAMKADVAQMKAEHAKARADRKAKLQEKINQLDTKIQAHLEKKKERRVAAERQAKAKVELLKTKAATLKVTAGETTI